MDESREGEKSLGYTPHPDEPVPRPLPFPEPVPGPAPWPPWPWPPDWWRCLRLGGVSGLYYGLRTAPTVGGKALDLRVDIDRRYANSPVMNRVSGDFYNIYTFSLPGRRPITWRVYQDSWIVDAPTVTWAKCSVTITGSVRFWKGIHLLTSAQIVIRWGTGTDEAEVTFTVAGGSGSTYVCTKKSDCFRDLTLEVDVCQSVNAEPLLPTYNTHAHATRPADLPQRTLTMEEAYREAGVAVTIRPDHTVIDDSAPQFASWSPAELHDAMETNFSQYSGGWPKWQMWGLLAGQFDNPLVAGIMFDAAAVYGGAGEPPERQGFAVFRNHSWFNNLVASPPANQDQAWATRQFLYTWVHEAGHAFNFLHSWNKGRPDSLSWMNYPQYVTDFWSNFRFRFDDEELIHMRHGDRASVIMGGDPWASGGHLESPALAMSQIEGPTPIEFLLRSKGYFEFLEPVVVEFRLRNLFDDLPIDLDTRLSPEYGGVIVHVQHPNGRIVEYAPIFCKIGTPEMRTLKPAKAALEGEDRYSESLLLSFGKYGFSFDEPGEYLVRAIYRGVGDVEVPSNVHRLRVGKPISKEEDRLAQDFFSYQVGMLLYLGGSRSPLLATGSELLESIADRYRDTIVGVQAALVLAQSLARPFFRLEKGVMRQTHTADPEKALGGTAPALALYKGDTSKAANLPYHNVVRLRAECLKSLGRTTEAKGEVASLREDLAARGVNRTVLDQIKAYEDGL